MREFDQRGQKDEVRHYYDRQSAEWATWVASEAAYFEPIKRALGTLDEWSRPRVLEVSSGSVPMGHLMPDCQTYVALDSSWEMLHHVESLEGRVVGLSEALPFAARRFDAVIGLNPVLNIGEACRVLVRGGVIVVGYSFGVHTPVYEAPEALLEQCPDGWSASAGRGVWGEFCVLRHA